MNMFWDLTDEEILKGITLLNDIEAKKDLQDFHARKLRIWAFMYDYTLQRLAEIWVECDHDRTLMKLKYADEIKDLSMNYPWFQSSRTKSRPHYG